MLATSLERRPLLTGEGGGGVRRMVARCTTLLPTTFGVARRKKQARARLASTACKTNSIASLPTSVVLLVMRFKKVFVGDALQESVWARMTENYKV